MIQATRHNYDYNELISTINIGFKMGEGGEMQKEDKKQKNQNHKYIYNSLNINNIQEGAITKF